MAKKIAIKIDVDTKRGYDEGVPRMLDVFKQENIKATFFFSMGTDLSLIHISMCFSGYIFNRIFSY